MAGTPSSRATDLQIAEPSDIQSPSLSTSGPESETQQPPCPVNETLYLIGRPTLRDFLRFVRSNAVSSPGEAILTEEWNAARSVVGALTESEAGCADNPSIRKIQLKDHEEFFTEFVKDPIVQNSFNSVPTEVAFVELDNLVVYQHHIDLTHVERIIQQLKDVTDERELFRMCLPYDHPRPPVKWSRPHKNTFVFISPSNDLRFLGTMSLEPKHIKDYPPPGSYAEVVGIAVGFGSNFLNAIYAEDRLILNNGSHRAYALRQMGFTSVPCIVQHVSSREELDLLAGSSIMDDPDNFLKHPRPSMLKDYFDPRLRKIVQTHRRVQQVTVKFTIDESSVPTF